MPAEVEEKMIEEGRRLEDLSPMSQERPSLQTYMELVTSLPWSTSTTDKLSVSAARAQLEADHCGLSEVKRRVLEYLAVSELKGSLRGPILCLVGPPGVGKTSISQSIATAIGRKFTRVSLGGVSDQSEIRGHRRTYLGSMPGRIIQGIKDAKTNNPVFLLDEVDKMVPQRLTLDTDNPGVLESRGLHGDPAAALLEVLDPEQNSTFTDHYLNVPFNLSNVMFIATANSVQDISSPLLDRMEVIKLKGYTSEEKMEIAKAHLLPKQVRENGLTPEQLSLEDAALRALVRSYTREAGVRSLERRLGGICRSVALHLLEHKEQNSVVVDIQRLRQILGTEPYGDVVNRGGWDCGVAAGLAWSEVGGQVLVVEASLIPQGEGKLSLTGQLGDVMKESAQIALAWLRANAPSVGVAKATMDRQDLHIHFPAGAVSKDGPSAGVTILAALVSLFTAHRVRKDTAMTGELTLRGLVLPVGGVKEKLTAAREAGFKRVLIPAQNKKVIAELPSSVKDNLEVIPVSRVEDVIRLALENGHDIFNPNVDVIFDFMSKL